MRPQPHLVRALLISLLASCALQGAEAAQGVWRIYNTSDCTELIGLVVLPESETVPQEEGGCTPASGNQYTSYSSAGFNLQPYASEGSGWHIHMIFDEQTCGPFYRTLFIGKVGECVNYLFRSIYGAGEQSFVFAECAPHHNASLFIAYGGPNCDAIYYPSEQVRLGPDEQCVAYTDPASTTAALLYRTTHCDGIAGLVPLNLTPFSTSRATVHLAGYWYVYWCAVAWLYL